MNYAIRSIRTINPYPSSSAVLFSPASSVKFRQVTTLSKKKPDQDNKNMEKAQNPNNPTDHKTGDVMSHSFGDGYATRSDDDGFGGIYGTTQSLPQADSDKHIHENHPDYDKSQGSEVKEKEQARHQTNASG